jgi:hypothetical protein
MIRVIRKTVALIWLTLPPLLLSALVHMADPDIDGWHGLASTSALWSVALFGVLGCALFALCLSALSTAGRSAFLIATALLSFCLGLVLTVFGSGAATIAGRVGTFAGCTGVVFAAIVTAVVPAAALGWPRSLPGTSAPLRSVGDGLSGGGVTMETSTTPPRGDRS